jgi:glycosyltransferase involved in cell wall biosynthesis
MIKIGVTELHGIAKEILAHPPDGVKYESIKPSSSFTNYLITSTAKGVLDFFDPDNIDIIEAPLFPILTKKKWIYTPADAATCMNFGILGSPLPNAMRIRILDHLFKKNNFKKLLFKSEAGKNSFIEYFKKIKKNDTVFKKIDVVYPAVRRIDERLMKHKQKKNNIIKITFVGDFLRKGGPHVVDAFEELQKTFSNIYLNICSGDDFKSKNIKLINKYKIKMADNKRINFVYLPRDVLMNKIYPETDIFVCPTYKESYGYAIEEAIAYGIPVIATNHFAIPEIIKHGKNGFLIDTHQFEFIKKFRGYTVNKIPEVFGSYMEKQIYNYLKLLIENRELRVRMGKNGLFIARTKFSFEKRNSIMKEIYENALKG